MGPQLSDFYVDEFFSSGLQGQELVWQHVDRKEIVFQAVCPHGFAAFIVVQRQIHQI